MTVLAPIHQAQLISYLKSLGTRLGLLLNFREVVLRNGIRRVVWSHRTSDRQQQTRNVHEAHEARDGLVVAGCDSPIAFEAVKEDFDSVA